MKTLVLSAMELELREIPNILSKKTYKNNIKIFSTGVGKVFAAAALQKYLLENRDIENIVLIGFAGSLNSNFNKGDLVFVTEAFQHDFGILKNGTLTRHKAGYINLKGAPKEIKIPLEYSKEISDKIKNIKTGIIATGDIFANDTKFKEELSKEADLVDMETGAICQVLEKYYPKIKLYSLRVISDSASNSADEEFSVSVPKMLDTLSSGAETILDWLY